MANIYEITSDYQRLMDMATDMENEEEATVDVVKPVKRSEAPEGYKVNPEFIETKSKRVQLLLQPSTVEAIKSLASKKGLSMNEAINEAIQEYLHKED